MIVELQQVNNYNGFITEVLNEGRSVYGCGTLAIYNAKKYLGIPALKNENQLEMELISKGIDECDNGTSRIDNIETYLLKEMSSYIKSVGSFENVELSELVTKMMSGSILICALELSRISEDVGHLGVMKMDQDGLKLDGIEISLRTLKEISKSKISEFVELKRMEE